MASELSKAEHYDVLVLGSGEAGKYLAWTLSSKEGKRCAVVERKYVGGSCPNIACLPSKNFVHTAKIAHYANKAFEYGVGPYVSSEEEGFKADIELVKARKTRMVDGLVEMHMEKFKTNNVELILGEGKFVTPKTISVKATGGSETPDRLLTAEFVIISTGSRATLDTSLPGLLEAKPHTHIELLNLNKLPSHLVIIGGGYVGIEFAQTFTRLGSRVTVLDRNSRFLKSEDEDVVDDLIGVMSKEGVYFCHSSSIQSIHGVSGESVSINLERTTEYGTLQSVIEASHILVATGRTPNTNGIGLGDIGIGVTDKGFVAVDENLHASVDGVFAVGDCAGSPHFTHVAYDDYRIVYNFMQGKPRPGGRSDRQIPSVLFTSPELAHVGLREKEAKAKGIKYRLAKLPMAGFLKTRTLGETDGFAKAMIGEDDKILGFTALGPGAGELLPVVQLAMKTGSPYQEIRDLVLTHPTLNEGLVFLFSAVSEKVSGN